jgi:hypothetical protein
MPLDLNNPTGDAYAIYGYDYTRAAGPVSTWYNITTLRAKYAKGVGFFEWLGYSEAQILSMDELHVMSQDYFWRTSNIMGVPSAGDANPWPDSVYANQNGNTSRGTLILPHIRAIQRCTLMQPPGAKVFGKHGASFISPSFQNMTGTALVQDEANWVGDPATNTGNFPGMNSVAVGQRPAMRAAFVANLSSFDAIRSMNWGLEAFNVGYSPGFEVGYLTFEGGLKTQGGYCDPVKSGYGVRLWDAGETSEVHHCRFDFH